MTPLKCVKLQSNTCDRNVPFRSFIKQFRELDSSDYFVNSGANYLSTLRLLSSHAVTDIVYTQDKRSYCILPY